MLTLTYLGETLEPNLALLLALILSLLINSFAALLPVLLSVQANAARHNQKQLEKLAPKPMY